MDDAGHDIHSAGRDRWLGSITPNGHFWRFQNTCKRAQEDHFQSLFLLFSQTSELFDFTFKTEALPHECLALMLPQFTHEEVFNVTDVGPGPRDF